MSGDNEYKYDGNDISALERYIAAMENLLKSEGWRYMERDLSGAEQHIIDGMAETSNPNDMIRAGGRLMAIRTQKRWPATMLTRAVEDLTRARKRAQSKEQ